MTEFRPIVDKYFQEHPEQKERRGGQDMDTQTQSGSHGCRSRVIMKADPPANCCAALVDSWRRIANDRMREYLQSPDEYWAKVSLHQAKVFEKCALELERHMEFRHNDKLTDRPDKS